MTATFERGQNTEVFGIFFKFFFPYADLVLCNKEWTYARGLLSAL